VIKQPKSRVKLTDKKSRVYIIDMSDIISIRYDAAVKYTSLFHHLEINRLNIEKNGSLRDDKVCFKSILSSNFSPHSSSHRYGT
jgi:hypothetical protein